MNDVVGRFPVIPAWMPESRHMDVNVQFGTAPESSTGLTSKLPSMALDTRIPAGMTASELFRKNDRMKYIFSLSVEF